MRSRDFQGGNAAYIDISLGVPGIVGRLHSNPDAGAAAEQLANPHGNRGRQRLLLCHDVMKMLPRNAEQAGNFNLLLARGRQHILTQQGAGVGGTPLEVSFGGMVGHFIPLWGGYNQSRASVVLFIVDTIRISILEFECDAPRSVHVNRIAGWLSVQTVEIEAKQIHFVGVYGSVQLVEPSQDSFVHLSVDLRRFFARPQVAERVAFEGFDHSRAVRSQQLT